MSKLIRFHASDVGNENAFYPEFGFDLRKNNAEPHLLIHAANGTGKTTILSVIFSLFDPRTDFFLHHVVDNKRHFKDYFVLGQPHFAAAEIMLPKSKTVVIGHYVYNKPGSGGTDIERFWFLFEPQFGLEFDDLPFSGLVAEGEALATRQQTLEWRQDMRQRFPGTFIVKEQQSAWTALLDEHGVDRSLIASQIAFSQIEGGMEGWLKVVGEPDLVERFLKLAIPNDEQDEQGQALLTAYKNITEAVKGLKGLPFKRRHFETLSGIQVKIDAFSLLVDAAAKDEAAFDTARRQLTEIAAEAQQLSDDLAADIANLEIAIKSGGETAKRELALMREAQSEAATAAKVMARFDLGGAQERHAQAKADRRQAERSKAAGEAALAKAAMIAATGTLSALTKQREDLARDSGSDMASLRSAGSRFHAALIREANQLDEKVRVDGQISRDNATRNAKLGASRDEHLRTARAAQVEAQQLRQAEINANQKLESLCARGALDVAETAMDALARHVARKEDLAGTIETIDMALAGAHEIITKADGKIATLSERIQGLDEQIDDHTRFIERGSDEKRKILSLSTFVAHAGESADIDPDDAEIDRQLRAELKSVESALDKARKELAEADSVILFIQEKGYGRPNEDAAKTVDALKSEGFWAVTAEGYLSENVPAVDRARNLIGADAAKFTGVFVRVEDLDRAEAALAQLRLKNPVVLSPLSTEAKYLADRRTLQPFSAGSFNKMAATQELEEWLRLAATRKADMELRSRQGSEIEATLQAITSWSRDYGGDRLKQRILKKQAAEEERRTWTSERNSAVTARDVEKIKVGELEARRRRAANALETATRMAAEVDAWVAYQAPAIEAAKALPAKEAEAKRATDHAAEVKSEMEAIDRENITLLTAITQNADASSRRKQEAGAITHRDATPTAPSDMPLESLRADYQSRVDNYNRTAGDQLARLEGEIRAAAARLTETEQELDKRRLDLTEEEIETARLEGGVEVIDAAQLAFAEAEARISATDREIGGAEASLKTAEQREREVGAHLAGESWLREEAEAVHVPALVETERAKLAAAAAEKSASDAKLAKTGKEGEKKLVDAALNRAETELNVEELTPKRLARPADELPKAIDEAMRDLKVADTTMRRSKSRAIGSWEQIQAVARGDAFREVEKALWVHFDTTTPEQAVIMSANIKTLVEDRISSVATELEQAEKDRKICLESMISIADQSANAIEAAVRAAHIPPESKRFAGMAIMKMRWKQDRLSQQEKTDHLSRLFDEWIDESPMPKDAWIFAAHCLLSCARWDGDRKSAPLGIELLRPKPENVGYATIAEMKFSGGEGLTAAILVYLMIAQTRARAANGMRRTGEAGLLILDNPIGQANRRDLIELQLYMAGVAGLQLIYATGINDEESISPFPHLIRMAPVAKQMINGTEHVRVGIRNWLLDRDDDATEAA